MAKNANRYSVKRKAVYLQAMYCIASVVVACSSSEPGAEAARWCVRFRVNDGHVGVRAECICFTVLDRVESFLCQRVVDQPKRSESVAAVDLHDQQWPGERHLTLRNDDQRRDRYARFVRR